MSLLTQKTELEKDLAAKDESIIRCAEAAHHLASVLKMENVRFWSLPTERLLAVMNYDPSATLATFAANTDAGTIVNDLLDRLNLPQFPNRAPVTAGRDDIEFDGSQFVQVEVPVVEEGEGEGEG